MEKSLRDLKLTNDELNRLGKAFKDPKFCKLFAEYAEELNDPENKRRYEEEIKMAEMERGVDVEFISPTPFCVLKSRIWPSLASEVGNDNQPPIEASKMVEGQKVFINICSSDKLGRPEVIPGGNGDPPTWSIPHSFSPPMEDLDKENKLCLVVDVVFHPEAIERSKGLRFLRNLLHATAVEGVHRQFGFFLGLTREQAMTAWLSSRLEEKSILASVRLLKGLTHKGLLRATVIRRKRADFAQCQERLVEAEKAAFVEARSGPNARESLAALAKYKRCLDEHMGTVETTPEGEETGLSSKYKKPDATITHSSEFDMLDYTNDCCHDIRSTRPTAIKVEIALPGIESAACLDLDITERKLHLQCEKPTAYQLELDLPYPVESEKGKAKFNKSTHKLLLTFPVIPAPVIKPVMAESKAKTEAESPIDNSVPLIEVLPSTTKQPDGGDSVTPVTAEIDDFLSSGKKRRRKKRGKHSNSISKSGSSVDPPNWVSAHTVETMHAIKLHRLSSVKLVVPKTSSLASVRVRQDLASFTVVVEVRNALPKSLQLAWSAGDDALRLMLTCSSRGTGECTLQWGVVMHCPAPTLSLHEEQLDDGGGDADDDAGGEQPRVICCDVSTNNVAIVVQKPSALRSWWRSIAVGRALGPGLQEVPVVGGSPIPTELPVCPPNASLQMSSVSLAVQSPDCVQFSIHEQSQNRVQETTGTDNSVVPPLPTAATVNKCGSVDSDSGLPLRGILKQRSTSESSLDGCGQTPFGSNLAAFPSQFVCSDEFPLNSEDEAILPPSTPRKHDTAPVSRDAIVRPLTLGRRRGNSVNFSKKDENVPFSPFDPVQTLHNLLRHKAKNARRSERRKRHSFTASSITLNEMQATSEHDAGEEELSPHTQKGKRKQRKLKKGEYAKEQARLRRDSDKRLVENGASGSSAPCLKSESEQEKPSFPKQESGKVGKSDGNGSELWNLNELFNRGHPSNPHATVCPVTLTASAIFELDEE
ncbi:protein kintoun [Echinococcus multilocularis]|uniref:Protein kintoun n=1 Tax=Echinococcus multilocularis TaxID=6211 RepID=A0A068Y3Q3_ECHMU|nr:protein kintoun [Echinococcus multilocularis]